MVPSPGRVISRRNVMSPPPSPDAIGPRTPSLLERLSVVAFFIACGVLGWKVVGATSGLGGWLAILAVARSEEHTSELQSRDNHVCRLLLDTKIKQQIKVEKERL